MSIKISFGLTPDQYKKLRVALIGTKYEDDVTTYTKDLLLNNCLPITHMGREKAPVVIEKRGYSDSPLKGEPVFLTEKQTSELHKLLLHSSMTVTELANHFAVHRNTIYYHRRKLRDQINASPVSRP